ncbi:MAG TPA: zf-HC2 domain-containing protein [Pyrinomonadaceae bacterium]|nr:zf-HC2 domain-containing protein [Pyrinomonadaceae bacterium]
MFSKHVTKNISAYCHGELSNEESKQFAEHIISCAKCRTKFEEVKLGVKLAQQLPKLSAPDHLWRELEDVLDGRSEVPAITSHRVSGRRPIFAFVAAAAAIFVVLGGFVLYYINLPSPTLPAGPRVSLTAQPSWRVDRLDGTPRIGNQIIHDDGQLRMGQVLETDGRSRARIAVGSIGNVDIDENTSVRLLATEPTEHRLELTRGKMSAMIWAPPRLFFVDTPSAVAADMGCAYTLEVDEHGGSLLQVTSGWVALELEGRESMVPAGAACETRKGIGPGTPYFVDATAYFRDALRVIDFNPDAAMRSEALSSMLHQARPRDTLTLWYLLARVNPKHRGRVYDKLAGFAPPPAGVTREGILQFDEAMLATWRSMLEITWIGTGKNLSKKGTYGTVKGGLSQRLKGMSPK